MPAPFADQRGAWRSASAVSRTSRPAVRRPVARSSGAAVSRTAIERGQRITCITDSRTGPHGLAANQLETCVRCGMAPLVAIHSATIVAAGRMGWMDRVGTLVPGRFADLVAVDGDPLLDVTVLDRPVVVVKDRRVALDLRARAG
jgi:imidazolonepropionase-like amidohydrolase